MSIPSIPRWCGSASRVRSEEVMTTSTRFRVREHLTVPQPHPGERLPMRVSTGVLSAVMLAAGACGDAGMATTTAAASESVVETTVTSTTTAAPSDDELQTPSVDDIESAVDSLCRAFEATDPNAAAALFAEEGVYVDKNGGEWIGRSKVTSYVNLVGPGITHCVRTGAVEASDDGSFLFAVEFTYKGVDYQRDVAVTMADGLIVSYDQLTGS